MSIFVWVRSRLPGIFLVPPTAQPRDRLRHSGSQHHDDGAGKKSEDRPQGRRTDQQMSGVPHIQPGICSHGYGFLLREKVDMYDARIMELSQMDAYLEPELGCLRGIATHTALSLCVEVGDFRRFALRSHDSRKEDISQKIMCQRCLRTADADLPLTHASL